MSSILIGMYLASCLLVIPFAYKEAYHKIEPVTLASHVVFLVILVISPLSLPMLLAERIHNS